MNKFMLFVKKRDEARRVNACVLVKHTSSVRMSVNIFSKFRAICGLNREVIILRVDRIRSEIKLGLYKFPVDRNLEI